MKLKVLAAVVVLLALGALVGMTREEGGGRDQGAASGGSAVVSADQGVAGVAAGGAQARGRRVDLAEQALSGAFPTRVVKTAVLRVDVGEDALERVERAALDLVAGAGGFVQSSVRDDGSARLVIRVPAEEFETVLADAKALGDVRSESVQGRDVSEEYVDLDARLRHWKAQEAVFLDLLRRAQSVPESIEVQRELSTVQETIEQLEGRKRFLDDRIELSTIDLRLAVPGAAALEPEPEGRLAEAWADAGDAALTVVGGTIVLLGAVVPLTAIVGGPALVAVLLLRRRRPAAPAL